MPAPQALAGLPKPILFGLYGALSGFIGAMFFAEPLYQIMLMSESNARGGANAGLLLVGAAMWTAAITTPICFALLVGQHHYLRGTFPPAETLLIGGLGGLGVGVVGGGMGQMCFFLAPPDNLFANCVLRIIAWALLGALAGLGLSFFIPNMNKLMGAAGGTAGGAVGCVFFLMAVFTVGDTVGRITGGVVLGFSIGVMVIVAETLFRRAWLEVRYGEREKITVTLGPEPVKIGGDAKACTVWARGAAPVALRFFVRDGEVICDDAVEKQECEADDGFEREVGNITVTVRIGAAETSPERRDRDRPRRKPAPRRDRRSRDEDDSDEAGSLIPAEVIPAPVPPLIPAEVVPTPPQPPRLPPTVPAMPSQPAIKPTTKDPDACPGCGRRIPGRPGTRYCMLCDQTY